jgi:hypothetical protein
MDDTNRILMKTTGDEERMGIESAVRAWEGLKFQCDAGNEAERKRMEVILKPQAHRESVIAQEPTPFPRKVQHRN